MSEEKKKCPACAEMIAADATICPSCHEKLQQQQSAQPSESKPKKLKIGAIIGAAIALAVLFYCCFANDYEIELSRLQERDNLYYEALKETIQDHEREAMGIRKKRKAQTKKSKKQGGKR